MDAVDSTDTFSATVPNQFPVGRPTVCNRCLSETLDCGADRSDDWPTTNKIWELVPNAKLHSGSILAQQGWSDRQYWVP